MPDYRESERGSETSETSPQGMSGCSRNPVSYLPRRKKTLESEREKIVNLTCVKVHLSPKKRKQSENKNRERVSDVYEVACMQRLRSLFPCRFRMRPPKSFSTLSQF